MMKKLSKLALLAVATALLLAGVTACSDDGDDFSKKMGIDVAKRFEEFGVTSLNKEVTFNQKGIVSASVDGTKLTLTSEAPGTTIMTIKVSGETAGKQYENEPINITVIVDDNGVIDWLSTDFTDFNIGKAPEPGVTIEGETSVAVDKEITLTAKATNFSGNVTYTWESDTPTKATVTQNSADPSQATVKGIAEGPAKITVTAKAGDTEKTADVTVTVTVNTPKPETKTYTLESNKLEAFAAGGKTDSDETTEGTNGYFTISWSATMKVDASEKKWDDGYSSNQRINMAGAWTGKKQFIKFTTTKAATVKVWWAAGGDSRKLQIAKFTGSTPTDIADSDGETAVKNTAYLSTFNLESADTWVLGSGDGGNYIFKVEVTE